MNQTARLSACPSRRRAYTLVELTLCIAIIATLAGIAIPRYARSIASYRAKAAANRIVNDIAQVQALARTTSHSQAIVFSQNANGYTIANLRDLDTAATTYSVSLSAEPYKATLTAINLGTDSQIIFDGFGNADRAGSVSVQSGEFIKTVSIDQITGKASVQ